MKIDIIKNDKYIIIPFWIMIFSVFWLQVLPQTESVLESFLFSSIFILSIYPAISYLSGVLLPKAVITRNYKVFLFQFLIVSALVGALFGGCLLLFLYLENRGVFPRSAYFNFSILHFYTIPILFSIGVFLNLCTCGVHFLLEYIKSQKVLVEYQLRTLQHQVTPHFMFNVLNHIHILMQTDVELASDLLIKYSEILRYQLYNGDKKNVILEKDIQFLKDFIAVEEVRWGDKLTVTSTWKLENPQKEIPALLFITFIENAFKHVSKSDFEKGYINIYFEQKENMILLDIENSKSALLTKKNNSGGLGLKNIKERLEILYFENYDLLIEESDAVYHTKLVIYI